MTARENGKITRTKVFGYIKECNQNGFSPTYREIAKACGISGNRAYIHVKRMEEEECVRLNGTRGAKVVIGCMYDKEVRNDTR